MKRNLILSGVDMMVRKAMMNYLSNYITLYYVTEFPKSGGSWVSQMLSDYLNIPFPRNSIPKITSCILHGHYLYSKKMKNTFVVIRDGRDVFVSLYYHCYFINDRYNERLVEKMKKLLPFEDYNDIKSNMPNFIRFFNEDKKPFGFSWSDFIKDWHSRKPHFVRYENLNYDCINEMSRVIKACLNTDPNIEKLENIVSKYSFGRIANRKIGDENKNSFLRKGIVGDWKNCFTDEAIKIFNHYSASELDLLGYSK